MNADNQTNDTERLTYLNIAFSSKGVAEYSGKRCVVFIPRENIQRVESSFGSRAERPMVQGIAGGVLGGLGVFGGYLATRAGLGLLRWEAGFLVFGGIGLWMLYEVMRRGHNLLVTGPKETRKLVFNGKVEEAELRQFLTNAARLGYDCR